MLQDRLGNPTGYLGPLAGGRVNPLAVKTCCPCRVPFLHLFVTSAAASPGKDGQREGDCQHCSHGLSSSW